MTPSERRRPRSSTLLLVVGGAILVAVTLFRVPLATVFTFGVLLICPLLMLGMHGRDHGAEHGGPDELPGQPRDHDDGVAHVHSNVVSPGHAPTLDPNQQYRGKGVQP